MVWLKPLMDISVLSPWHIYQVHIGRLDPGYQIQFVGRIDVVNTRINPFRDMSLDEIKFVNCDANSTVPAQPANLTCDFESGTCGWFDWNIGSTNKIDWVSN